MDGTQVRNLLLFSTVFAVVGGLPVLTDRLGPKRTLAGVILFWLPRTVGCVMRVALSLPEMIGEFFEFFSLTEKVSAGAGPALTAAMLFIFGGGAVGYRISIGSLAVIIAAGHFLLLRVPDTRREGKVDEFAPLIRRPRERKMYAVKGNIREQSWLAAVR